jgi:diacylglycerol kinase
MATSTASTSSDESETTPGDTDVENNVARPPKRAAFLQSFVYAFAGVRYVVGTQRNMRVHLAIAVLALAAGVWLHISPIEFALIFMAIVSVIVSEMFNTVVEACVDLAVQRYHPLAKVAKDVAAGAVLVNAILSVIVGLLVFGPHLLALWQHHR